MPKNSIEKITFPRLYYQVCYAMKNVGNFGKKEESKNARFKSAHKLHQLEHRFALDASRNM